MGHGVADVGSVLGTAIFLTPSEIARALPHGGLILAVWIAGGLLTLAGALTYAELGAMFPRAGGQYHYLKEAYGKFAGLPLRLGLLLRDHVGRDRRASPPVLASTSASSSRSFQTAIGFFPVPIGSLRVDGQRRTARRGPRDRVVDGRQRARRPRGRAGAESLTILKVGSLGLFVALGFFVAAAGLPAPLRPPAAGRLRERDRRRVDCRPLGLRRLVQRDVLGRRDARSRQDPAARTARGYRWPSWSFTWRSTRRTCAPSRFPRWPPRRASERPRPSRLFGPSVARLVSAGDPRRDVRLPFGQHPGLLPDLSAHGARRPLLLRPRENRAPPRRPAREPRGAGHLGRRAGPLRVLRAALHLRRLHRGRPLYRDGRGHLRPPPEQPGAARPYRVWGYPWVPGFFIASSAAIIANTLFEKPVESVAGLGLLALGLPAYGIWRRKAARS